MTVQAIAYVELQVEDAHKTAADLTEAYGFAADDRAAPGRPGLDTVLAAQGGIRLLIGSATEPGHPAGEFVRRHGDGVAVLALLCADPRAALDQALRHGAERLDGAGLVRGFGDVALRFVGADDPVLAVPAPAGLLQELDHVAICVPAGELEAAIAFSEQALGFRQIFGEYIEVGAQAMDSRVVQSPSGAVTFTLLEPDPARQPGQIDTFLESHEGAGVQHLAFRTDDIAHAVRTLSGRGVEFLRTPGAYFDELERRLGPTGIPVEVLRELNVLVDQDHDGQLFQIFTRSVHRRRTFFLELIERRGAGTFGSSNIKALYEAVERQNLGGTREH